MLDPKIVESAMTEYVKQRIIHQLTSESLFANYAVFPPVHVPWHKRIYRRLRYRLLKLPHRWFCCDPDCDYS